MKLDMHNKYKSLIIHENIFDEHLYLSLYKDVRDSGVDPLDHFIRFGILEGRYPSCNFSPSFCKDQYKDISSSMDLLEHFVRYTNSDEHILISESEQARLNDIKLISQSEYWDTEYYLKKYTDIADSGVNPIVHFYEKGWQEGRNPSERFYTAFYVEMYSARLEPGQNPLIHFLSEGLDSGKITIPPNLSGKNIDKNLILKHSFLYFFDNIRKKFNKKRNRLHLYISGWIITRVANFNPSLILELSDGQTIIINNNQFRRDVDDKFGSTGKPSGFLCSTLISDEVKGIKIFEKETRYVLFEGPISELKILKQTSDEYFAWLKKNRITENQKPEIKKEIKQFDYKPLISVVIPVYNMNTDWLRQAVESVIEQLYDKWELCIVDDASDNKETISYLNSLKDDTKIKILFRNENGHICNATNDAVNMSNGEFIVFLDHDDVLQYNALYEIVKLLQEKPDLDLIYSDEDKLSIADERFNPFFKPDYSKYLLLSSNYINHITCIRRSLYEEIGGLRPGFEGSQDYDMVLRAIEKTGNISHIPNVLYSWRMVPESVGSNPEGVSKVVLNARNALQGYLKRNKIERLIYQPEFTKDKAPLFQFDIEECKEEVCIIIFMKNNHEITQKCIDSILNKTTYSNYRILLIDNESDDPDTLRFLRSINDKKIEIERIPNKDDHFSHSYLTNQSVNLCSEEYLLFLNNDTEVVEPRWLNRMMAYALFQDVGAVGAKLLFPDDKIQHAGIILGTGKENLPGNALYSFPQESHKYYNLDIVAGDKSAVTAACMLTKRSAFNRVNGFDEIDFPVTYNDVDYCLRLQQQDMKIVYCAEAVLYHHESYSRKKKQETAPGETFKKKYSNIKDPYYNINLSTNDYYQIDND